MVRWLAMVLVVLFCPLLAMPPLPASGQVPTVDARIALNAYGALIEQELDCARDGLRILAATSDVRSGDWKRVEGPLARYAKGVPAGAAAWFATPDGSYFTVAEGRTTLSLKDRDYFPRLMAGKEVEGDLVISKSTGKRTTIIAVPVLDGGRVIGAVGVSLSMEKIASIVDAEIDFPGDVMFYALDRHGQIALHRQSKLLFEFASQLGSPTLTAAVKEMLSKPEGTAHYRFEGADRTALFKRFGSHGWVYALRW